MLDLERKGILDRRAERLPDAEEIADRRRTGEGLVAPEAAALLAHAKIDAVRRILESPLLTRPAMDRFAAAYFPAAAVRAARHVGRHPLRDRILATVIANRFVNHHGAAALWRLTQDLGLAASRVVESSIRAEEIVGALDLRRDLTAAEGVLCVDPPHRDLFALEEAVLRATRWIVRHGGAAADFDRLDRRFLGLARRLLPPNERARFEADRADARRRGAPPGLAERLASLRHLRTFLDVVDVARHHRCGVVEAGRLVYEVGARLEYPAILDLLEAAPRGGEWDRAAAANVVSDLRQARRRIAERVIAEYDGRIEKYLELRFRSLDSIRAMAARIAAEPGPGLTPFVVFSDQVNNLAAL
jgi:glutamate dehydrogenase